jgi:hypothetical protein
MTSNEALSVPLPNGKKLCIVCPYFFSAASIGAELLQDLSLLDGFTQTTACAAVVGGRGAPPAPDLCSPLGSMMMLVA